MLPRNRPGFSLVEMVLALTMLAIVLSFAVPAASRSVQQARADRAAYAVKQDLEQAFSLAMRERKPVTLAVDTVNRIYSIVDRGTGAVVVRRAMAPKTSEFGLTRLGTSHTSATVYPNGLASSVVSLFVEVGPNRRRVQLSRAGHVRVSSY